MYIQFEALKFFVMTVEPEDYFFIRQKEVNGAAAVMIRFTNGDYLLVEQDRFPIGKRVVEIPRGLAMEGEASLDCAVREGQEETGYRLRPENVQFLGSIHPDDGILDSEIDIYVAMVDEADLEGDFDDEIVGLKRYTPKELEAKILAGEIKDSFTISALCLLKLRGLE